MPKSLRLALPKGRLQEGVVRLLGDAGFPLRVTERSYRPLASSNALTVKLLKAQNIAKLVEMGSHDCGFAGLDWIRESGADVAELLDTTLDPVQVVVAGPRAARIERGKRVVIASEYEQLTRNWAAGRGVDLVFVRSYGASEVFPPEDADLVVDNTSSGTTLAEHDLAVVEVLVESSTRFVANRRSLEETEVGQRIRDLVVLMESVLQARARVLLEMNVDADKLDGLVAVLPAMKSPTVQPLYGGSRYAVKVAVRRSEVSEIIPRIRAHGATDILQYALEKVIP